MTPSGTHTYRQRRVNPAFRVLYLQFRGGAPSPFRPERDRQV